MAQNLHTPSGDSCGSIQCTQQTHEMLIILWERVAAPVQFLCDTLLSCKMKCPDKTINLMCGIRHTHIMYSVENVHLCIIQRRTNTHQNHHQKNGAACPADDPRCSPCARYCTMHPYMMFVHSVPTHNAHNSRELLCWTQIVGPPSLLLLRLLLLYALAIRFNLTPRRRWIQGDVTLLTSFGPFGARPLCAAAVFLLPTTYSSLQHVNLSACVRAALCMRISWLRTGNRRACLRVRRLWRRSLLTHTRKSERARNPEALIMRSANADAMATAKHQRIRHMVRTCA